MRYYIYSQNNSGGSFDDDPERGIGYIVYIEAPTADAANQRAEDIGLYFNGCETGQDCDCCGDRWYEMSSYDEDPEEHGWSYVDSLDEVKEHYENQFKGELGRLCRWGVASYVHPLRGGIIKLEEPPLEK